MARTLQQIITELNKADSGRVARAQTQKQGIGKQLEADEAALGSRKMQAFDSILEGARGRGLGFSGIPLGEQAKYVSTDYLPNLAKLRQGAQERRGGLEDFILGIGSENRKSAMGIRQSELDRAESQRQYNESLALERAKLAASQRAASQQSASRMFDFGQSQQQQSIPNVRIDERSPGSFTFRGADDNPITAANYANQTNQDIRDVLYDIGSRGDKVAANLYNQLDEASRYGSDTFNRALSQYEKQFPWIFGQ